MIIFLVLRRHRAAAMFCLEHGRTPNPGRAVLLRRSHKPWVASSLKRCFLPIAGMMFRMDLPPAVSGRFCALDRARHGEAGFDCRIF
jgi:hypothetical protein